MKIVVDDKIPYICEKLAFLADDVVYLKGSEISNEDVKNADALIVRTRTRCDKQLLEGSKVQFVATATIGFDHIDTAYMRQAGIYWTNCPGCNAASVAQYLECSLLLLKQEKGLDFQEITIGIIGCGHVGSKVKAVAELTDGTEGYKYEGVDFKIKATVDAVQTHNANDAMMSAWGRTN